MPSQKLKQNPMQSSLREIALEDGTGDCPASPRPWRTAENQLGWMSVVVDADGGEVAVFWGGEHFDRATAEADAALAVAAANAAAKCERAWEFFLLAAKGTSFPHHDPDHAPPLLPETGATGATGASPACPASPAGPARPRRNCDRFDTHNDARAAFLRSYFGPTEPEFVEDAFARWLFEPEKGGAQ